MNLTLPSGWFGTWTSSDDVVLETVCIAPITAGWRITAALSQRLGGVILAAARDVEGSVAEMKRCGNSRWAWGVLVYAPYGTPLDHPDLEPIWAEAAGSIWPSCSTPLP